MIAKVILSILQLIAALFFIGGIITAYIMFEHYNAGMHESAWIFFLAFLMLLTPALAVWVLHLLKKRV